MGRQDSDTDKGQLTRFIKDEDMMRALRKKGINKLFPIQYETFNIIRDGLDVVAKDRTGSGKTLAFALPRIVRMREEKKFSDHCIKFLIVLPTRELAIQVKDEIQSLKLPSGSQDFRVAAVYGGSGIQEQLSAVERGVDIIVGTPGRLIDFLNRGAIDFTHLQTICLDEADEMLKIGFKEDIEKIFEFITKKKSDKVQCLLFSATIPEWIWEISDRYQSSSKKFIDMMKDNKLRTSKTVEHHCMKANGSEKQAQLGSLLRYFLKGKNGKIIIFCETKREVDRIGSSGLIPMSVAVLHGDIKQFQRERVFRKFKSGEVDCLIATNVAARGLDFPEIDLIVQMQPPPNSDTYIHRSGRTGRAGKSGICVTLYNYREEDSMKKIQDETMITLHHINNNDLPPGNNNRDNRDDRDRNRNRSPDWNRNGSRGQERDRDYGRDNRNQRQNRDYRDNRYQADRNRFDDRNHRSNGYDDSRRDRQYNNNRGRQYDNNRDYEQRNDYRNNGGNQYSNRDDPRTSYQNRSQPRSNDYERESNRMPEKKAEDIDY